MKTNQSELTTRMNYGRIALPSLNGFIFCEISEIVYCRSESNYTRIFLKNGNSLLISRTLKSFEQVFENLPFVRIHNSYIVNLNYIQAYNKSAGGYVVLDNGKEISIAKSRKKLFVQTIFNINKV